MRAARFVRIAAVLAAFAATGAFAGGPLSICSDASHTLLAYSPATVTLNYDQGNLGSRTKAQTDALVTSAVSLWTSVGTATISIGRGADLPVDVTTANYSTYYGNYTDTLNPVIYDTDGSIVDLLLGTDARESVLGFAGSAYYGAPTCKYAEGQAVISGYLSVSDTTLSNVITHEVGHLIGMDHTQLDSDQGLASSNYPMMYPIAYRSTATLHEDDIAAVSALYPDATLNSVYGQLSGTFVLADGVSPVLGANLWAQETTTLKTYSVVSDYLAQGTGYFKLLLPAGTYNLRAGAIHLAFDEGSSVGPYSETSTSPSFLSPLYSGSTPMATLTLGNGSPTAIVITAGCAATVTFRMDGTGSVGGNCAPAGPPSAPTMGTATAGPGQVSVTFTPGSLNSGTLVNHQVTCTASSGPAFNGYGMSSPIIVSGLTGGTAYRCWARTITNLGTSGWSGASNWATPTSITGPPTAPIMGTATAGAGQVSVTFTPGSLNGGTLVNHQVTCTASSGPAFNGYAMSSPIVVSGLTGGTPYRCWARTITNLGTSGWSGASNWATPTSTTGPPTAPIMGAATAGPAQVTVTFTPGSLNGGTLTTHHVTCTAATGPAYNGYGMSSPIVVQGLASGTQYRCWARTMTNLGTSAWSGVSNWATPTNGLPAAPTMAMATAGPAQVTVSFTAGSLNGGTLSTIQVACSDAGGTAYNGYGMASPIVVAGLASGTAYRCWVRALTNIGWGAWSGATNWATPTNGPPAAPTMVIATAGSLQVSVAFTAGSLNGGTLDHHEVTCTASSGPAFVGTGMSSPIVVTGLTSGTAYRCWARTVTNLGTGAWSGVSNWATPTP